MRTHADTQGRGRVKVQAETGVESPQSEACQQPAAGGQGWNRPPPEPQRQRGPADSWMLDVWPPAPWKNEHLLLQATQFVGLLGPSWEIHSLQQERSRSWQKKYFLKTTAGMCLGRRVLPNTPQQPRDSDVIIIVCRWRSCRPQLAPSSEVAIALQEGTAEEQRLAAGTRVRGRPPATDSPPLPRMPGEGPLGSAVLWQCGCPGSYRCRRPRWPLLEAQLTAPSLPPLPAQGGADNTKPSNTEAGKVCQVRLLGASPYTKLRCPPGQAGTERQAGAWWGSVGWRGLNHCRGEGGWV